MSRHPRAQPPMRRTHRERSPDAPAIRPAVATAVSDYASIPRRLIAHARVAIAAATATVLTLTGCSQTVTGLGVSSLYNPDRVGGIPVQEGPSGLRPDSLPPNGKVRYTNDSAEDRLALLAANDVEQFWRQNYRLSGLNGSWPWLDNFASYDSEERIGPPLCGQDLYHQPNAFYCPREQLIAWDRGVLIPVAQKYFGDMAVAALIGHEYGHAVQMSAGIVDRSTPVIVREQQADCLAGTYIRWVAQNASPRFALSTGDGLNKVLAGVITIRDPVLTPEDEELVEGGHGTALDRVGAFQTGFIDGAAACAAMNLNSVQASRGDLPLVLTEDGGTLQTGESPVDERLVNNVVEWLNATFSPTSPPTVSLKAPAEPCPDAKPTAAMSFCPATNTITVDLPALQSLGAPAGRDEHVLVQGDNTAMSALTSRYMLALQHQRGASLDTPNAALRTACLTGVAQRGMVSPRELPSHTSIVLTAGDLDEAVAGLLSNGIAASNVNGDTVPAGFTRIAAFRSGLIKPDADGCYRRFP